MTYVLLAALIIFVFWLVSVYNFFVSTKTRVGAAIQEIGNQLKRQSELIPNLEASVKGYLKHEKGIFDELSGARKEIASAVDSGDINKMSDAGKVIGDMLPKMQVVVESNPEIKGNDVVKGLMDELRDTSDKIMFSRRLLIDLTADYNVKRVTFPSNLVAKMFRFEKLKGLETSEDDLSLKVSSEDTKTPKISL